MHKSLFLICLVSVVAILSGAIQAGTISPQDEDHHLQQNSHVGSEVNWLTGEGVSLGGILFPHAHFQSVFGQTTADDLEHFGAGHHDPDSDGWTIQGFEFGTSLRAGEWLEGFATYHLFQDAETRDWDGEFEEWFLKATKLPGGLELRGGRYLNRFGFQNQVHLHGWDFVDNNLVNGRMLGDDSLSTIGAEITWTLPVNWTSVLSVSLGEAQGEEHEHGHGPGHEGGEHEHEDFAFEGEDALFDGTIAVANWTNQMDYNDFHQFRFGLSGAFGDNRMNESSEVYGAHLEYLWRQNGYEAGGSYLRFRTELMVRRFDYLSLHEEEEHDEHGAEEEHDEHESHEHRGSETEAGLYASLLYRLDNGWEFGLRGDYVQGVTNTELSERYRISPSVTFYLNKSRTLYLRTQYNFDHGADFGDEHSVWSQIGFNWGGSEVR